MGGSGGGSYTGVSSKDFLEVVRSSRSQATNTEFETKLARTLGELLGDFNSRDAELVSERLGEAKAVLEAELDGSIDQLFGGSVAKHTYVDGLSDIDSLLIVNDTALKGEKPQAVLSKMQAILDKALGKSIEVSHGRMAVTLTYRDGMMLQLLPALEGDGGEIKVPSSRTKGWSKIDPLAFQRALTKANSECGGKIIPTIKLAKAINGQLGDDKQLSGYHMESLAIAAFKGYDGPKTTTTMLPIFFERAKELVLRPIKDKSGQSIHVDGYLGEADSPERLTVSREFGRIAKRMRNAIASESLGQWKALFGYDS